MLVARAALGAAEVIPAGVFVEMRALDPHGLLRGVDPAVENDRARTDERLGRGIELLLPDGPVAGIQRLVVGRVAIVHQPRAAAVVEEQRGVDAVETQPHRVGPRAGGIPGGHEEVSTAVDHCAHDVAPPSPRAPPG